jgi:non-specific serine/threonine protein kinase
MRVPLRQPRVGGGNLPSEVTSFIGRGSELARLRELQAETRLLTLVGPGGVGKTRLALRLAAELGESFSGGTWLVDLTPVADPSLVAQALGDLFGVQQRPGQSLLIELTAALRSRSVLLVLDNCEHFVAACADLVSGLLRACPDLKVIATSLQPFGAEGELTWRVPPLSLPRETASELHEVDASEAVRLFVARVRFHVPEFTLNQQNATTVADICRRLDGLPLALELVAARVEALGVAEVAARLSDLIALAIATSRSAPARQRTLQAALEWSCSMLEERELTLLRRLAVFVGGWTLRAAEGVCAGGRLDRMSVADVCERLVTKSLVVVEHTGLSVRYRMLETVRAHALRQLEEADEAPALQREQADFLLHLVEGVDPLSVDATQAAVLHTEEGNVRAALEWSVRNEQAETGLRIAAAAYPLWMYSGHIAEARVWLERLLGMPSAASAQAARANALTIEAQLLLQLGDFQGSYARGQIALAEHQARGDTLGVGLALTALGNAALHRGDLAQADTLHTDAAAHLRAVRNPTLAINLRQLGLVAFELGDVERARRYIDEVEAIGRANGDRYAVASAVFERGVLAAADGDAEAAAKLLEQALVLVRASENQQGTIDVLTALGHVRLDQGQREKPHAAFLEATRLAQASSERVRLVRALEGCARCFARTDKDAAVRLAGAAAGQRQDLGMLLWPSERRCLDGWLTDARRTLGSSAYQHAWEDGHASTLDQAVSLAGALSAQAPAATPRGILSPREKEVAIMLASGLTNKQIAAELVVSPGTVRMHVEHILNKLDLRSRAQVGVWASQQGLLPVSRQR